MKIAVIGAGSFVFGPSVLAQAFLEERLNDAELALMDVDAAALAGMAGVGRRMAREAGLSGSSVTAHADRASALDGADFVVCCAAPQMRRRFAIDREIVHRLSPGHILTEFGGIAGISYSLRQIAFIEGLAADVRARCPAAPLLTVSNPLPRVAQAAEAGGVRTIGFCSVAQAAYGMLSALMHDGGVPPIEYPYTEAKCLWDVETAGLNHHAFVVRFRDRASGADLLPALRERVAAGAGCGNPRSERLVRETGYLLVPGDSHTQDFFATDPAEIAPLHDDQPYHGGAAEREQRIALLYAIAEGAKPWDALLVHEAWEKPFALIAAYAGRSAEAHFPSLNLSNADSHLAGLPADVFVETPVRASAGRIDPVPVTLPDAVLPLCRRTASVTDAIVRAARARSRRLVHDAVDLDPTITDKQAGRAAIDACLEAHADLIGAYGT
jgi:alpha-galactosidase